MKRIFAILILLGASLSLTAAPINESKARKIAEDFFACNTTRTLGVTLEWSGSDLNVQGAATRATVDNPMLYIYNRSDNGGFVIVAGDDSVRPIVAYSFERAFEVDRVSPEVKELLNAWCEQIAAADGESRVVTRADVDLGDVIAEYQTAKWNQDSPFNDKCPVIGGDRSVTGCVATAMAIICYYNKWPQSVSASIPSYQYVDVNNVTQTVPANIITSRIYNYTNMLSDYSGSYTTTQGNAVATLLYDLGTMVKMNYHPTGSGAFDRDAAIALTTHCKYSKGAKLVSHAAYTEEEWTALLQNNLKTYGPTYFSGSGESGGHAFVLDGCTDKGFFQINFGWSGYGNGYFLLPNIEFYEWQQAIIELTPDKNQTSTYEVQLALYNNGTIPGLLSDATVYEQGKAFDVVALVYNDGFVDFDGVIELCLCDNNGTIKEVLGSQTRQIGQNVGYQISFTPTITSTIKAGDRLRIYYKDNNSDSEKQWARASNPEAVNELIICGSAEDIAKSLIIGYEPHYVQDGTEYKALLIQSSMAIQCKLLNQDKSAVLLEDNVRANIMAGYLISSSIGTNSYWLRVYASGTEYYDLELVF